LSPMPWRRTFGVLPMNVTALSFTAMLIALAAWAQQDAPLTLDQMLLAHSANAQLPGRSRRHRSRSSTLETSVCSFPAADLPVFGAPAADERCYLLRRPWRPRGGPHSVGSTPTGVCGRGAAGAKISDGGPHAGSSRRLSNRGEGSRAGSAHAVRHLPGRESEIGFRREGIERLQVYLTTVRSRRAAVQRQLDEARLQFNELMGRSCQSSVRSR
jgi:hypothetical protein